MDLRCLQGPAQPCLPPAGQDQANTHATHTGARCGRANGEPRGLGAPDVDRLRIQTLAAWLRQGGARDWKYRAASAPVLSWAGGRTSRPGPCHGARSERVLIRNRGAASIRLRPQSSGFRSDGPGRSARCRVGAGVNRLRFSIAGPGVRRCDEVRKWEPPRPGRETVDHSWMGSVPMACAVPDPSPGRWARPLLDAAAGGTPAMAMPNSRTPVSAP